MRRLIALGRAGALCALVACTPESTGGKSEHEVVFEDHAWTHLFDEIRADRWDQAYQRMASAYRKDHDLDQFRRAVQANSLLTSQTGSSTGSFGACDGMNIGSCAKGGLDTPIGRVLFEVYYVYEGDQERLVTIAIAGVPVVGIGVSPPPPAPGSPADPGPADSGAVR